MINPSNYSHVEFPYGTKLILRATFWVPFGQLLCEKQIEMLKVNEWWTTIESRMKIDDSKIMCIFVFFIGVVFFMTGTEIWYK
jgi:hypothetical protein